MMIPNIGGVYERAITQVAPVKPLSRAPGKATKVRRTQSAKRARDEEANAVPRMDGLSVSARTMEAIVYLSASTD